MAKKVINGITGFTHDGSAVEGVVQMTVNVTSIEKASSSDGEPETTDVVGYRYGGDVIFENIDAANQALGGSISNAVVSALAGGNVGETITLKNLVFTGHASELPHLGTPGSRARFRVPYRLNPGSADTPATMIANAAA